MGGKLKSLVSLAKVVDALVGGLGAPSHIDYPLLLVELFVTTVIPIASGATLG